MKNKIILAALFTLFSLVTYAQKTSDKAISTIVQKANEAFDKKEFSDAAECFLSAADKVRTTDISMYVSMNIGAAKSYANMQLHDKAVKIAKDLLKLDISDTEQHEIETFLYDNAVSRVSVILKDNVKKYAEARAVYEDIKNCVHGDILKNLNIKLQYTYITEGRCHISEVNFEKAIDAFKRGYEISNEDDNQILTILYNIASLYDNIGDYSTAISYYEKSRELASKIKDDNTHYKSLKYERKIYKNLNDMEKVYSLGVTLDSLMQNNNNPVLLSEFYDYIGNEAVSLGNYDEAEAYFSRYTDLMKLDVSEVYKDGFKSYYYNNMRDLKRKQNDYKSAIEFSKKLIHSYSELYDTSNFIRYIAYLVNTQLYSEIGDSVNFERCSDTLRYAYNIAPDAFNKSLIYNFIGAGYSKLGKGNKALQCYEKADSILAEKFGETFDMRITLLELYAGELKKMGRFDEACEKYKHNMDLVSRVNGKKSKQYSRAVFMYANCLAMAGKNENNAALYSESINILEDILRAQLRYVPSNERQFYIKTFSDYLWKMLSYILNYKDVDKEFIKCCYNSTIMLKSLLFESDRSMYNTLQHKGSDEDVADFIKMTSLRMQRKSMFKNYSKNKEMIDSLSIQIRNMDNQLTAKSKLYSEYTSFLNFKYEDICKYLGKNDVLFDFFDIKDTYGRKKYIAYVVRKDFETPLVIDLFYENEIDSLLGTSMDKIYTPEKSPAALDLLWNSIAEYAKEGANVYYVPSGIMYQISLESLVVPDGSLLGEHFKFTRLTSAHRINDIKKPLEGEKKAVLYGGLTYDIDVADMQRESSKFNHSQLYSMRSTAKGVSKFDYLPETLYETEKISSILKKNGYDVVYYTAGEGTEESFLSMHNNSPQILHVATHGFYYTPNEALHNSFLKGYKDAMLLSGLVLSGGNAAWMGKDLPQGVLGGIISAGNISCLDLSNINLVVLSACQSGQGKVTLEGLYGLQRAFKKAGAKTIVMTLWNVSDKVTGEFMVEFYKNLFNGKKSIDKRKAFIKAKQKIRNKYPEPHYWAGFVMVD